MTVGLGRIADLVQSSRVDTRVSSSNWKWTMGCCAPDSCKGVVEVVLYVNESNQECLDHDMEKYVFYELIITQIHGLLSV